MAMRQENLFRVPAHLAQCYRARRPVEFEASSAGGFHLRREAAEINRIDRQPKQIGAGILSGPVLGFSLNNDLSYGDSI